MQKRPFGKTGLSVSALGFGGAPVGFLDVEQQRVSTLLNQLLDSGVNVIDTAAVYPGSEELIGRAVSHRRQDYVLISKCGQAFDDLPGKSWSAEVITATVDRALRRLRTDHLDVMLLHSCKLEVLKSGEALGALIQARAAGKIRHVGYSGDNDAALYALRQPDVAVLETSLNLCDQANLAEVLPLARQADIGVIVKRPIANAVWRWKDLPEFYKDYATPYHERFTAMGLRPEDLGFTAADWPEIALRFVLSQPGVSTAIIGTTKLENARRNSELAAKGPLPEAALKAIASAFKAAEAKSGRRWLAET